MKGPGAYRVDKSLFLSAIFAKQNEFHSTGYVSKPSVEWGLLSSLKAEMMWKTVNWIFFRLVLLGVIIHLLDISFWI